MNHIFIAALLLYLIVFALIGILDIRNTKSFTDYSVAGKKQSSFSVVMTLLATVTGASTTIGITSTVYDIGFPGIWWLLFGAVGLILQSVFLSERVRNTGADTLPDLAGRIVGRPAELIISVIIVISWIGVIAGQLVAMNSLITFAVGRNDPMIFVITSLIVIAYTAAGGQMSVVKTDKVQLFVILAGVAVCMGWLYVAKGENNPVIFRNIRLLNDDYGTADLFTQFFVIGGVYFLGPDIMSRNFIAKDGRSAVRAARTAGAVLAVFSVVITLIGMWIRYNVTPEEMGDMGALMYAISIMPGWAAVLLIFGLLSAILSSTDTCIINASTIFVKDILKKESVTGVRITVIVIGLAALALAYFGKGDIMSLLTGAYSIYTPGVIFPLAAGILAYKKRRIKTGIWITAVLAGGIFGILGTYFGPELAGIGVPPAIMSNLTLIGMGISLILSLLSVDRKESEK
ncbi:MAG: sodium:solute symporter family protein [Lachnospiraceae bacterium]|nr:sodium:solute symporter family protein [Lachnospiraceae bacterium]